MRERERERETRDERERRRENETREREREREREGDDAIKCKHRIRRFIASRRNCFSSPVQVLL